MHRRGAGWGLLASILALVGVSLAVPGSAAPAFDLAGGKGDVDYAVYGTISVPNTPNERYGPVRYDYIVYKPVGWRKSERLPLYVLLHGCATTANQMMGSTLLNRVADRERFLVVYADNQGGCWHAVSEDAYSTSAITGGNITRGRGGEADIIAGITKRVTANYNANADRVYLMGMSSGAFQTSATASAYPELYAAIGENAGGGAGMSTLCAGYPEPVVAAYARYAVSAMAKRARVMPFFAIGGTLDPLGEQPGVGGCVRLAYLQWLYTNNILNPAPGALEPGASALLPPLLQPATGRLDTYQDDPASTRDGQVRDGWSWTRHVARNPLGCQVAERWIVHGMSHYWSGGSTAPRYSAFNDPKGPSASELSWRFFKQFSRQKGNTACTL